MVSKAQKMGREAGKRGQEMSSLLDSFNCKKPSDLKELNKLKAYLTEHEVGFTTPDTLSSISPVYRVHFEHGGHSWSVIIGFGSYGRAQGLLELYSSAMAAPIGWLTCEDVIRKVFEGGLYNE